MSYTDLEKFEVLLMIDQATGKIFPFSAHGFQWAQGRYSSLVQQSSNWLFLDERGCVHAIKNIRAHDNGFTAKLKRLAGLAYRIEVELAVCKMEITALKQRVMAGMRDYKSQTIQDESWAFSTLALSEIEPLVLASPDAESLYAILGLPNAMDCLDLL